jgi:molybdate transport system substrate-binding protein
LTDLADPERTVVMCAPEVPCGAAAVKAFDVAGLVASPDSLEQDVKSVVAKVAAGEADAGVVYVTDARAAADTTDEVALPKAERITTDYPIVALSGSASAAAAASSFIALVRSGEGQVVLEKYGFQVP